MDEYGGVAGLVTMHDVLEALVGHLPTAGGAAEPAVTRREDGSWLLDGMLPVDELRAVLELPELPTEDAGEYNTLGGFVLAQLGRVPEPGDHFHWGGLRFEVVDMDGRRVDKVLVVPEQAA
jgi:putative hemolysin